MVTATLPGDELSVVNVERRLLLDDVDWTVT
jgi:hypothetical protein